MNGMRLGMGDIDQIPQTDTRRVEFNRLHKYSTILEESIFFLGLGALSYLAPFIIRNCSHSSVRFSRGARAGRPTKS